MGRVAPRPPKPPPPPRPPQEDNPGEGPPWLMAFIGVALAACVGLWGWLLLFPGGFP